MRTIVIGAGYWGINYIRELGSSLVGVVDLDPTRTDYVLKTYGVGVYADIDRALDDCVGAEAAVITTPPSRHVEIATKCLEAGMYVLIEKPLAMSVESCWSLHTYRDRIMAGLIYQYHPQVEWLKGEFAKRPYSHGYSRRTNAGPVRSWHNALWDLAPHDISIFNYVVGNTPVDYASIYRDGWASLWMEYAGGFETLTYVSWLGSPKTRTVELVDADYYAERLVFDDMRYVYEISPLRRMIDDFLSLSWAESGRCTFQQGLDVVKVLEGVGRATQTS